MGLFSGNADKIDLSRKLNQEELKLLIMAIQSQSGDIRSWQLASDLSTGKRSWITKSERSTILSCIDSAIPKLEAVSILPSNAHQLEVLKRVKSKL